jgi:hypothetical protein
MALRLTFHGLQHDSKGRSIQPILYPEVNLKPHPVVIFCKMKAEFVGGTFSLVGIPVSQISEVAWDFCPSLVYLISGHFQYNSVGFGIKIESG